MSGDIRVETWYTKSLSFRGRNFYYTMKTLWPYKVPFIRYNSGLVYLASGYSIK